jgi:hypothetical protein
MLGVAETFLHWERERWLKLMGSEFTGYHEGRRVRLMWHERTVGHICRGADPYGQHLECIRMVEQAWVFVRSKAGP